MRFYLLLIITVSAPILPQDVGFEVASVKRNISGSQQAGGGIVPNGANIVNLSLRAIIQLAYGIGQPSNVINAPNWIVTERYDIAARDSDRVKQDEMGRMLRALLKERFSLAVHKERREVMAYTLMLARPGGKLGPQLHVSTAECTDLLDGTAPKDAVRCGPPPGGQGKLILVESPISLAVDLLSLRLKGPVVDKTGLTGKYDLELSFAPIQDAPGGIGRGLNPEASDPGRPSIFTAVQERLDLKLDPAKLRKKFLSSITSTGRPRISRASDNVPQVVSVDRKSAVEPF